MLALGPSLNGCNSVCTATPIAVMRRSCSDLMHSTGVQGQELVQFPKGKIVGARWLIKHILGYGAYGIVYEVQDIKNSEITGALKVESNSAPESILKIEVEVLKHLQKREHTMRLLHSGKRETYSYVVMTLCGPDLVQVKHNKNLATFSERTVLRIAILGLYALKQLHEVGYVHRDIKPSNIALSPVDRHTVYLLDFGMVRRYAVRDANKRWLIRPPRKRVLLRGTLRYCSVNTHKRKEQGRVDDLWSFMYMLVDLRSDRLPWSKATREDRILYVKESITDKQLLADAQLEFYEKILMHLRTLHYADRPNYLHIYKLMVLPLKQKRYRFQDPYDWEGIEEHATQESSQSTSPQSQQHSSPKSQCVYQDEKSGYHPFIPQNIPMAQRAAFGEASDDVPDITKTEYKVAKHRSGHSQSHSGKDRQSEESGMGNDDILP